MAKLVEYKDMAPRAKAVVETIARGRSIKPDEINNVWKALAHHPDVMERFAEELKLAMGPGKLDPLTKELIYLAVSVNNNCEYCITSHTFAARKHGLDDAMLAEFNEIVALANAGNRLTMGLQVEPDERFKPRHADKPWSVKKAGGKKKDKKK